MIKLHQTILLLLFFCFSCDLPLEPGVNPSKPGAKLPEANIEPPKPDGGPVVLNPPLDPIIKLLIEKQKAQFPVIWTELQDKGRKRGHWVWWVFPTEKMGDSEELPKTSVNIKTAEELLKNADMAFWTKILQKIDKLLRDALNGNIQPRNNVPSTEIIPAADHDRIKYSIDFWLITAKDITAKYPDFEAALKSLDAFDWTTYRP